MYSVFAIFFQIEQINHSEVKEKWNECLQLS